MTMNKIYKKQQIIILSQYFPPDMSGAGTRAYNYAKCLQNDYDVIVITAHPHLHKPVPKNLKLKLISKETLEGIKIIRVWVPSLLHTSALNRIILHISYIITSLVPMFQLKPKIIFIFQPNLFSIIPGYIYSKIRGGKIIRAVDDLWPEVLYERGYVKSKILKKILNKLAEVSYTIPKYNLSTIKEVSVFIEKKYNISKEKITEVEHGVDLSNYKIIDRERNKDFVLMYSGSLVESYDFDMILTVAEKLKDKKIKFIIRGRGILREYLESQKEKRKLSNITIDTNFVPLTKIADALNNADVFIMPMKNEEGINLNLPTKILEYQAMGKPIICCSNGAPGNFIERTNSGFKIKCEDTESLLNIILKLKNDPKLCQKLGKNGREFIEKNISFDKIQKRLKVIMEKVLKEKID